MPRRIVIGVGIAAYPRHAAGLAWTFIQWVLAFRAIGWDVWMVEDIPSAKCADDNGQPCAPDVSSNLAQWKAVTGEFGLQGRTTLLIDGQSPDLPELLRFTRDAEFFFNICGHFKHKEILGAAPLRVYADLDPAFTQIWAENYKSDMNFDGHDIFMSYGRNIGKAGARCPLAGRNWLPLGVPVMLDHWTNPQIEKPGDVWTTFTHWYGYPQVEYDGQWYGNKSEEYDKLVDVPRKTKEKLEIATDLHPDDPVTKRFLGAGWRLIEARPLNTPWQRYREYLAQSRGEFSVAKNGYVRSRCGWFSERTVCYLALGRPVVFQDTGWSDHYPHGEGLLPFHDEESALAALEKVAQDPVRHGLAARRIAETHCSGPVVARQFLETIGLA